MALAIATNNAALQAAASASSVNREMDTSMARLSSGKRINSAQDDAAGVAIASRLSSEIRGTDQAIRNALDGQALIDTAEGGHNEIENILQRLREISVQSANDTNDSDDRLNLQAEMDALITEIDRIASVTTWAGQSMFSGEAHSDKTDFSFQVGTATGTKNQIGITLSAMSASALGLSTFPPSAAPATLNDITFSTSGAVPGVTEVTAVDYVAPVTGVAAVAYVAPVTGVAAVDYVAPVTEVVGVNEVVEVTTPAELISGKLGDGTSMIAGIMSLNNGLESTTLKIAAYPAATPPTYSVDVSIDLGPASDINTTVDDFNAAAISVGSDMRAIVSDADGTDGKIEIIGGTNPGAGVVFAPDSANVTTDATIESNGVVTFNKTVANLTFPLSSPAVEGEAPTIDALEINSGSSGGLASAVTAINLQSAVHGFTAETEAVDVTDADGNVTQTTQLRIRLNSEVEDPATSGMLADGSSQLALADITSTKTGNDIVTTAYVAPVTAVAGVTEVDAVAYVAEVTEVDAVAYVAEVAEVTEVFGVAGVTEVAASADGSMTTPAGILTAGPGRESLTLNLGTENIITVDNLDGDNSQADAQMIADEINATTASHKFTAETVDNNDGTYSIKVIPGDQPVSETSVASASQARDAIAVIDAGIKSVNTQRSELGAVSNRLSHTVNNLTNISSNLSAAKGGIEDADFAFETTNLAKNQILQQASTAMLAQANASKQNVLSLLQG